MNTEITKTLPLCQSKEHHSGSYSIIHYGTRPSAQGLRLRYLCRDKSGNSHTFLALPTGELSADARLKKQSVKCPNPKHKGSRVLSRGTREAKNGSWLRFFCQSTNYPPHYFRLLTTEGPTLLNTAKPPICTEHPKSKIVRNGTKGVGVTKRQSYFCQPLGGTRHRFSPPLSREAVVPMSSCSGCDELLSPHKGALTASRHTPWTLNSIIQALNNLSLGQSYAATSRDLRAQHQHSKRHLHSTTTSTTSAATTSISPTSPRTTSPRTTSPRTTSPPTTSPSSSPTSSSASRDEGRNSWHLAANIVEQYSPLLFADVSRAMVEYEKRQREKNDAFLAENPEQPLRTPIVYLLDDVPIFINQRNSKRVTTQQDSWALLVVVELRWQESKDPNNLPKREARLRLARAYPRRHEDAWMLVLNELPVVPDFIIADAGSAIQGAFTRFYTGRKPVFVPSLYHIHKNIRAVLQKVSGGSSKSGKKVFLSKSLNDAANFMAREDLLQLSPQELSDCWDNLIAEVARTGEPTAKISIQRKMNEPKMLESITTLRKYPQLPASNAAVESRIRLDLDPFLANRKARYRNLARTNFLLDLAVCRSQGAFIDLTKLAKKIRESNESANGWAPTPRAVADHQPQGTAANTQMYSSLLSAPMIAKLSAARQIAPAAPKTVPVFLRAVKNPGAGSGRPLGSKNKPKPVIK